MLEVGCGLGQDAIAIARMAGDRGRVVAIDFSSRMIHEAARSAEVTDSVHFCLADACKIPFGDGTFDGARADRVLQHLLDPERAFAEMVRTVKDGGRVVVYEPDWGTFIISPGEKEVCRIMTQLFGDAFPSGWIGRRLPALFREAALEEVQIKPRTFFTGDLELAARVFDLVNNAHRAVELGHVSEMEAVGWLENLERAQEQGTFFCSYTGFLVSGKKSKKAPESRS